MFLYGKHEGNGARFAWFLINHHEIVSSEKFNLEKYSCVCQAAGNARPETRPDA
jgi:hypothetical protein